MTDLRGADTKTQRTQRTVGRRVTVAADDQQSGLRQTLLGTYHMNDALSGVV